ncbi:MAG: TatD family hydrolase [Phycisphaerales bacterium]|nr:MAG: TatD family hydrolase [Phycisphaerales bacterium]
MSLIDSHAHLTFPELADCVEDVLGRCAQAGVEKVITVGIDPPDARAAVELAQRYPNQVHAAIGVHPHNAQKVDETDLIELAKLWDHPTVVGFGEMGLDYHYDFADRGAQQSVFARQLTLAKDRDRPIIIHSRKALDDTIRLLLEHGYDQHPVVFHCFTGAKDEAARIAEHGWWISFTGIVTFRDPGQLKEIAGAHPADQLMIETDSPFLSPAPVRNKRPNEPAHLIHTAGFLADVRGVEYEALAEQTRQNTQKFFRV